MFYDNLPKDRNGFILLDKRFKCAPSSGKEKIIDDGRFYFKFFKNFNKSDYKKLKLAYGLDYPINEIINEIIAKSFGFGTPNYKLVRHKDCVGVVSTSMYSIYPNAMTMSNFRMVKDFKTQFVSLCSYYQEVKAGNISKELFEKLQMCVLYCAGMGLYDSHEGNILVNTNPDNPSEDKVLLIDQERNYGSIYNQKKELDNVMKNGSAVNVYFGISSQEQYYDSFYTDIERSQHISTSVIKNYLDIVTNLLTSDKIFKEINYEIKEEYGKKPPREIVDRLKIIMTSTTKNIKNSFENRIIE